MANIVSIVQGLDIGDYFDLLISGSGLPRSKPDPAIFVQAASGLGVSPDRSVVLEDSTMGVEAAVRAGMRCVALTTTRPASELHDADRIVDSLEALEPEVIENLLKQ